MPTESIIETPDGARYLIRIEAAGIVRDAEGNVVNPDLTLTGESVVTEADIIDRIGDL